jgi:TonB-linked SusC/RagA family outer membrane protein
MKARWILLFLSFCWINATSQTLLQGTVTDAQTGEALIGVNVYVKNYPNQGSTTDLDGVFRFEAAADADVLVASYIGYKTLETPINGQTSFDLQLLPETALLDEVIVTSFGVKKEKKTLGYAAEDIGGDALVESRETNLIASLTGKVAGVDITSTSGNPGASANIVIRGRTSLSGNNDPLIVVDGVPIDNSYLGSNFTDQSNRAIDVNPNDIESITVLKGTAATALYGMRAGNGALIITTKKGKADGNTRINLSSSLTFDQVNKLPERQQTFAQGIGGSYIDPISGSPSSWGPNIDSLRYADDPNYTYSAAGRIVGQSSPLATNRAVEPFENTRDFFQTGITSNSNLSVTGGNEQANYLLNIGYHNQTGVVPNSTFERTNVKVGGSVKPYEKLKFSAYATYSLSGGNRQQRGSNLSGVMLGLLRTPPTFDITNGVEDPVDNPDAWQLKDGSQRKYNPSYDNPYWSINKNLVKDKVDRIIGYGQIDYTIHPLVSLTYRLGLDHYFEERKSYWDGESGEFRSINGLVINDLISYTGLNSDLLLNFNYRAENTFSVDFLLGHSYLYNRFYNAIEEGENFVIPGFYDISNAQVLIVDDFLDREKTIGAFGELKLGYGDYLYLSLTGRNDWSSTLPPGQWSFFYPSASLSYIFTEQLGLSTNKVFNYGKLRVSYGESSNAAPSPYLLNIPFSSVGQIQGRTSFLRSTSIGNTDLRPERNTSFEAGLELRFFNNRIGLDATYYQKLSRDQILPIPVAFSSGFTTLIGNAGEVENKGVEVLLNLSPVRKEQLNWDIDINFASNRNTVLELFEGIPFLPLPGSGLTSTQNVVISGQPYGVIFGTRWLRDDSGNILIDDNGYPIVDSERGIVGDPNPEWRMGIRNSLSWKNWSLSFLFDIRRGGDLFNGTRGVMRNLGIHADTESREEEVIIEGVRQSDGQVNDVPIRLDENYYSRYPFAGVSEAVVEDASFVRLRDLTLRFNLPSVWLDASFFSGGSIAFTGRNLLLFTDYSGIDPETNLSGASNSFGRDYFNAPNTRSFGVSFNFDF